jgi:hypothetical protein
MIMSDIMSSQMRVDDSGQYGHISTEMLRSYVGGSERQVSKGHRVPCESPEAVSLIDMRLLIALGSRSFRSMRSEEET